MVEPLWKAVWRYLKKLKVDTTKLNQHTQKHNGKETMENTVTRKLEIKWL